MYDISDLKKRSRGFFSEYAAKRRLSHNLNTQVSIKDFSSSGYGHTQVFKRSNKHTSSNKDALSCLLRHRLKHTNLKNQMHCTVQLDIDAAFMIQFNLQSYPAPPPRGVRRDSHIISKTIQRYRDTDSHTDKSFKAALRRPTGVWDAAVYLHFKAQ